MATGLDVDELSARAGVARVGGARLGGGVAGAARAAAGGGRVDGDVDAAAVAAAGVGQGDARAADGGGVDGAAAGRPVLVALPPVPETAVALPASPPLPPVALTVGVVGGGAAAAAGGGGREVDGGVAAVAAAGVGDGRCSTRRWRVALMAPVPVVTTALLALPPAPEVAVALPPWPPSPPRTVTLVVLVALPLEPVVALALELAPVLAVLSLPPLAVESPVPPELPELARGDGSRRQRWSGRGCPSCELLVPVVALPPFPVPDDEPVPADGDVSVLEDAPPVEPLLSLLADGVRVPVDPLLPAVGLPAALALPPFPPFDLPNPLLVPPMAVPVPSPPPRARTRLLALPAVPP